MMTLVSMVADEERCGCSF